MTTQTSIDRSVGEDGGSGGGGWLGLDWLMSMAGFVEDDDGEGVGGNGVSRCRESRQSNIQSIDGEGGKGDRPKHLDIHIT